MSVSSSTFLQFFRLIAFNLTPALRQPFLHTPGFPNSHYRDNPTVVNISTCLSGLQCGPVKGRFDEIECYHVEPES